jgi:enamine deaminase RidA (YjgF/YER057c/UK114 family)
MAIRDQLAALHITLPEVAPPAAAFVPFVRTGALVFLSGHIARRDGKPWTGRLGDDLTTADGQAAARAVAVDLLATLQLAAGGDLERVARIVKLLVLVSSAPSFTEQHLVANGASQLFVDVFGERGAHARSAFGAAQLPLGACVEIELVAELA